MKENIKQDKQEIEQKLDEIIERNNRETKKNDKRKV